MADEKILIEIEVDNEQALKNLDKQNQELEELEENQKKISKEQGKNSQEYQLNAQRIKEVRQQRNANLKLIKAETSSLGQIKGALAAANKARDNANLSTAKGRAEYRKLTKEIKSYNTQLKAAEQQGGSFSRNVGNYTEGLSQVSPAAGGVINSIKGMTAAAKAFIATPLGLILTAIAAAFGAVVAYFKRTEEGGDKLAVAMAYVEGVFSSVMDVVVALGKFLVTTFINNFKFAANNAKLAFGSLKNVALGLKLVYEQLFGSAEDVAKAQKALNDNIADMKKIAKEQIDIVKNQVDASKDLVKETVEIVKATGEEAEANANLQRSENALRKVKRERIVQDAKLNEQIFKNLKIAKDENATYEEREAALKKATAAEQQLANNRVKVAEEEARIARERAELYSSDADELDKVAAAEAKVTEARTNSLRTQTKIQSTLLTFQKQKEAEDNKEAARLQKLADQEADLAKKKEEVRIKEIEDDKKRYEETVALEESEYARKQEAIKREYTDKEEQLFQLAKLEFEHNEYLKSLDEDYAASTLEVNAKIKADNEKKAQEEAQIAEQVKTYKDGLLQASFGLAKTIAGENADLVKAIGLVEVGVNTARGIMQAFATLPTAAAFPAALKIGAAGAAQAIAIGRAGSSTAVNQVPTSPGLSPNTTAADQNAQQTAALQQAIENIGLTISVSEINDVQNNVQVQQQTASI